MLPSFRNLNAERTHLLVAVIKQGNHRRLMEVGCIKLTVDRVSRSNVLGKIPVACVWSSYPSVSLPRSSIGRSIAITHRSIANCSKASLTHLISTVAAIHQTWHRNQAMNVNILKLLGKRSLARGHRCCAACSQEQSEAKCR